MMMRNMRAFCSSLQSDSAIFQVIRSGETAAERALQHRGIIFLHTHSDHYIHLVSAACERLVQELLRNGFGTTVWLSSAFVRL